MGNIQDFKSTNTIAYDRLLREKIDYIHRLLGTTVTDVTTSTITANFSWSFEISQLRKELSGTTADLNLILISNGDGTHEPFDTKDLINKLQKLVEIISQDIVSSAFTTINSTNKWIEEAESIRAELSQLTADLTVALMNASKDKEKLSQSEQDSQRGVQILIEELGNFGFAFTKMINDIEGLKGYLQEIVDLSNPLMDKITVFMNTYRLNRDDKDTIKKIIDFLGNAEFKLNKTLNVMEKYQSSAVNLHSNSFEISKKIMDAQDKFRAVRSSINDYGFLSDDPLMANLFKEALSKETNI